MTTLNISGSLFAISFVTWLLHVVTELNKGVGYLRLSDAWLTALALLFLVLYVAIAGWLGHSVVQTFSDAIWGLSVTAGLYVFTVAATVHTLRKRHTSRSETSLPHASHTST